MPDEHDPESPQRAFASAMILQIDRPGEEAPLQFPAVIRNLAAKTATMEVINPWTILNWETLKGQGGCLRLLAETGEVIDLQGTVTWAKYTVQGQDSGNLNLGLELVNPDPSAYKLLFENIPHTSKDIKGFWDRWDQAQVSQAPKVPPITPWIGFSALALLLSGLALQLTGTTGFKLFGWVLWCFGTVVVAFQALRFWRSRNASH